MRANLNPEFSRGMLFATSITVQRCKLHQEVSVKTPMCSTGHLRGLLETRQRGRSSDWFCDRTEADILDLCLGIDKIIVGCEPRQTKTWDVATPVRQIEGSLLPFDTATIIVEVLKTCTI
jgi:hypothetical protein